MNVSAASKSAATPALAEAITPQSQEAPEPPAPSARSQFFQWLELHLDWVAAAVVVIGFIIRLHRASLGFFNPDETLTFMPMQIKSLGAIWRVAVLAPYPPFFTLLLYVTSRFSDAEFIVRIPFVMAGSGFLWFAYRWIKLMFGAAAGWLGLVLLTFSPPMVTLGSELRPYAVQLFWMAAALYFMERAFSERPTRNIWIFTACLWLSILSHYQAFWFTLAAGVYVLLRVWNRELPQRAAKLWAALQVATFCLCLFFYKVHLARFHGDPMERYAIDVWLRDSYFHPESQTLMQYVTSATKSLFGYFINPESTGWIAFALFTVGLSLLAWRWIRNHERAAGALALMLVIPFVGSCAAALRQIYPYGGSRHNSYLAPFAVAAIVYTLSVLLRRRLSSAVLVSLIALPIWMNGTEPHRYDIEVANQRMEWMHEAVEYMRANIPPGGVMFGDLETSSPLAFYLGNRQPTSSSFVGQALSGAWHDPAGFFETSIAGRRAIFSDRWSMKPGEFIKEYSTMRQRYGFKPDDTIWVVDAGFAPSMSYEFANINSPLTLPYRREFGKNISVFQFPIDLKAPEPQPSSQ